MHGRQCQVSVLTRPWVEVGGSSCRWKGGVCAQILTLAQQSCCPRRGDSDQPSADQLDSRERETCAIVFNLTSSFVRSRCFNERKEYISLRPRNTLQCLCRSAKSGAHWHISGQSYAAQRWFYFWQHCKCKYAQTPCNTHESFASASFCLIEHSCPFPRPGWHVIMSESCVKEKRANSLSEVSLAWANSRHLSPKNGFIDIATVFSDFKNITSYQREGGALIDHFQSWGWRPSSRGSVDSTLTLPRSFKLSPKVFRLSRFFHLPSNRDGLHSTHTCTQTPSLTFSIQDIWCFGTVGKTTSSSTTHKF